MYCWRGARALPDLRTRSETCRSPLPERPGSLAGSSWHAPSGSAPPPARPSREPPTRLPGSGWPRPAAVPVRRSRAPSHSARPTPAVHVHRRYSSPATPAVAQECQPLPTPPPRRAATAPSQHVSAWTTADGPLSSACPGPAPARRQADAVPSALRTRFLLNRSVQGLFIAHRFPVPSHQRCRRVRLTTGVGRRSGLTVSGAELP